MALFVDGNITGLQELKAQESSILDVASNEGLDLQTKLDVAQVEIALELEDFLRQNYGERIPRMTVEHVVLDSGLRRWHCLYTLMLAFRDACHSQLNDRYRAKFELYRDLADDAGKRALSRGLGVVENPVHASDPDIPAVDQEPFFYVIADRRLRRG
jgi:hypothetical protein